MSNEENALSADVDHGALPPWRVADLPEPLPFSLTNIFRTIGPGAILLAGSIGGGEWIVGPLMAVKYGTGILWIASVGIILQAVFNLEAVRYTLYTGEPILTGVMRLNPGPRFWSLFYILAGIAQLATPAIAAGCATVLYAAFCGRMPVAADHPTLTAIGMGVVLICALLLVSGKTIEKLLEKLSWAMILFIFTFLVAVNFWCVPLKASLETASGFVVVHPLPANVNFLLLGLFAATSGSGGLGNLAISNWFRDKGFGMGSRVGSIGGALAEESSQVEPIGYRFPINTENLRRWKTWWRYSLLDQQALWAVGCFLGMFLNVNLALAIIPAGVDLPGYSSGTFQAHYLSEKFWNGLWMLTLINGFWILFSTHLGNTDCLVRTVTDMLWAASPRIQRVPASRIYSTILVILTAWALYSIRLGSALDLFKILGIIASPMMALSALQILRINTRFLPAEIRPSWMRRGLLLLCSLFYGAISVALLAELLQM